MTTKATAEISKRSAFYWPATRAATSTSTAVDEPPQLSLEIEAILSLEVRDPTSVRA